jgi:aminoglycoside phosphotransferase (APT) family kinase protein
MTGVTLDTDAVGQYLVNRGIASGPVRAELISGGRSNLTYILNVDERRMVLRRPPLGTTLATAHDMGRERRVLTGLARSPVPVPAIVDFCEDKSVLGCSFYIMEFVDGSVIRRNVDLTGYEGPELNQLIVELVDTLVNLHGVVPQDVGLAGFGRPDGFLIRQLKRWTVQLQNSRTRELPAADKLAAELGKAIPPQRHQAIVHGDYRLDNCVVGGGSIRAVLDWEMSTLGDPLSDLASFLVYHHGLADMENSIVESPGLLAGTPTKAEMLERYFSQTFFASDDFNWYEAFAWFKLAVILEGVVDRASKGQMGEQDMQGAHDLVIPCLARGLASLTTNY